MEKVCFIVRQYGLEVNGGAEYHCRMLAERLTDAYEVDVVTSRIIDYNTFEPYYKSDIDYLNKVRVLRFDSIPFNRDEHEIWKKKSKSSRKLRRSLFRLGLLKPLADINPRWDFGVESEENYFKTSGFYSVDALTYLEEHQHEYKAIIVVSYSFPLSVFGAQIAPEKTIFIPTLHEESEAFRSILTRVFTTVKHIGFNTEEEADLAKRIFGKRLSTSSIIAVGVETDFETKITREEIVSKFNLPEQYIHYFGRVCNSKMDNLIPWFINYKKKFPSDLKLVLTGKLFQEKAEHPDIIYTGFVSDEEKIALINAATLVINPSKLESLSLLQLEAMDLGKTVIVNGKSEVMKAHVIKSDYAAAYYEDERTFQQAIQKYISNPSLLIQNVEKAKAYIKNNYNWDLIMTRLKSLIQTF